MEIPVFKATPEPLMHFRGFLTDAQKAFYSLWVKSMNAGIHIPLCGNDGYIFCYLNEILDRDLGFSRVNELGHINANYDPPSNATCRIVASECLRLAKECGERPARACLRLASDCYVLLGEYQKALEVYPRPPMGARNSFQTDSLIDLKRIVGERINAADILTLLGPRTTSWGRNQLSSIMLYLETALRAYEEHNAVNLIEDWAIDSHKYPYPVFLGSPRILKAPIVSCSYSRNERVGEFVRRLTREAENTVREEQGIPRIGEGWMSETTLFYELKAEFSKEPVIQHAQPKWLGPQHLDVFLPMRAVGVEFQGPQHDEPVHYFGGIEAFQKVKERDARKLRRCTENGVSIVYVRAGYLLHDVVKQVIDKTGSCHQENPQPGLP